MRMPKHLRGALDFQFGVKKERAQKNRVETPDWMHENRQVKEFLKRMFPKLDTDKRQHIQAQRWLFVIVQYFRGERVSRGMIATTLGVSDANGSIDYSEHPPRSERLAPRRRPAHRPREGPSTQVTSATRTAQTQAGLPQESPAPCPSAMNRSLSAKKRKKNPSFKAKPFTRRWLLNLEKYCSVSRI